MKHFKIISLGTFCLLMALPGISQKNKTLVKCATMERLENLYQRQPALRNRFEDQLKVFNKMIDGLL